MRQKIWLLVVLSAGTGVLADPPPAAAQTAPVRVALTGTAAPAGGNYSEFFNPVLNAAGQVAFDGRLTGGSSFQGLFVGMPGAVQAAVLSGTPAPAGGNYSGFNLSVLNGSGQLAFFANLTGGSSTRGIFVGVPGAIQAAALQGTSAPAGGNFDNFFEPALNGSGRVAFVADLTGGSSTQGIFAGTTGMLQTVALRGNAAPAGGNYSTFFANSAIPIPTLNGSGQVAFRAGLTGGTSTSGVFVGAPGAVQVAALSGTPAPAGGNYSDFGNPDFLNPALNGAGQVAFLANLTGGSSTRGIFVGAPGAIQAAALQGTSAPGGGNYSDIFEPTLNRAGQVGFTAGVTGGSSPEGIFVGAPGAVQAVALIGTPAPGGGNYNFLSQPVLNGSGQVAFRAGLTGTGITAANDEGLYAGTVGGLVKVAREGDQVDVDPGAGVDLRTIADFGVRFGSQTDSGGEDGLGVTFNDSGFLTYELRFTDGSRGVFVSQVVPVPEPATVGLAAAAGLAAAGWLRRRVGRHAEPGAAADTGRM